MRRHHSPLVYYSDTATTEIYTLSLHDALPISLYTDTILRTLPEAPRRRRVLVPLDADRAQDRKSTRLNSSHMSISYAVFCLKKKKRHPFAERCNGPARQSRERRTCHSSRRRRR